MRSFSILVLILLSSSLLSAQRGKAKKWKEEAKEDVLILSSKNYPYIDKFHDALREKIKGNLAEATQLFKECLRENDKDDAVYYALGTIAYDQRNLHEAKQYLTKAYELDAQNITYVQELAYIHYERSEFEESAKYFDKLCELEPRNLDYRYGYLRVQMFLRKYAEAITSIDILQDLAGTVPELSLMKADLYSDLKKKKEQEQVLLDLKQEFPDSKEVIVAVISFYEKNGEEDKAILLLQEMIEKEPNNMEAHHVLAKKYFEQGKNEEFKQIALTIMRNPNAPLNETNEFLSLMTQFDRGDHNFQEELLEISKNTYKNNTSSFEAGVNYAEMLQRFSLTKEAIDVYKDIVNNNKNDVKAWINLLSFELDCWEYEELYKDATNAIEFYPNIPEFFELAARGALYSGRKDEVTDLLAQAELFVLNNKYEEARIAVAYGQYYFEKKDYKKGIVYFEKAINLDEYANLKIEYALALSKANIALKVAEELLTAIPEENKVMAYYFTKGIYYLRTKEVDKGIQLLEEGIQKDFHNKGELYDLLGDFYYLTGKLNKASEAWTNAEEFQSRNKSLSKKIKDKKLYDPIYYK